VGFGASGIDNHPENEDMVLTSDDSKQFSLWKQPNKLRLTFTISVFFIRCSISSNRYNITDLKKK